MDLGRSRLLDLGMISKQTTGNPADRAIYAGFLALLLWLPLPVGSNRVWAVVLMYILLSLLAVGWLGLWLRRRVSPGAALVGARWVVLAFVLWLIWLVLQRLPLPSGLLSWLSPRAWQAWRAVGLQGDVPLSLDPWAGGLFWLKSLSYLLVFFLTLVLISSRDRLQRLMLVLVLSGAFQAVYGSLMVMSGLEWGFFFEKDTGRGVATGTFINRNHLAGYLELCLALGIGLLLAGLDEGRVLGWRQRLRNWARTLLGPKLRLRVLLAVMVVGLVMTHSRMGNTAFFTSLLVAGGLWLVATGRRSWSAPLLLLGSLLVIDIFIVGHWFGVERVVQRLEQTHIQTEQRRYVAEDTLAPVRDFWRTGSGAGSFYTVYPAYRDGVVEGFYDHAHNDYLELAVETGLPGGLLLLLIALPSWWVGLQSMWRRRRRLYRGAGFSVTMAGISFAMHSSVDFNLQIPSNAALFMVLLALGWIAAYQRPSAD